MKKITLLFTLLLVSFLSEAQVVESQNFDAALGWTSSATGWARRTTGGSPACNTFAGLGMARFNAYNLSAGTSVRLTSPAINFTGATYRVKFKMYRDSGYPTDADRVRLYYNTTGGAGGTLLGTVNRSKDLAPVVAEDGWYSYAFDLPGTLTGTGYVAFLGTSAYGNNIFIDEVTVEEIPTNDAEMNALNVNPIVQVGAVSIAGAIRNFGSTPITSIDVNWQVDGGTVYTQSLTGLNINSGQVYSFTHADQWNATAGLYSLNVWVSNINGGAVDADATNDNITKSIAVASNSTARLPLYEKFSSSTCPPCATFNSTYYNPFLSTGNNSNNLAAIAYQVNWPGTGDPYYTLETGTRVQYYGVSGAPTLYVDSKEGTNFSTSLLQSDLSAALANPAYFVLEATKTLDGTQMTVDVNTIPYLTGQYKIYAAVVEKQTTGNIASNGETEFHNVMMKMMPDAQGTVVDFTYDVPNSTQVSADLFDTFIEDYNDLDVVVFIQNAATKQIMQSTYATEALANTQFNAASKIKLYPNPSTGFVRVASEAPVDVVITDITGKVVYSINEITNETQLNLSSLQKGIYLAKVTGEGVQQTQKIVLK
jgi:hypothetical protein